MEVAYCEIVYDVEDRIYIAKSSAFHGVQAHGSCPEAALQEMEYVLGVENLKHKAVPGCLARPCPYENS